MIAHLVTLRLRMLVGSLRRGPWQVIGTLLGAGYGLVAALLAWGGFVALRLADAEIAGPVAVTIGSAIVAGYLLVPLAFGFDDAMDPRAFATFGIEPKQLVRGLALVSLIGIPSLVVLVIASAQFVTWVRDPLSTVAALIGAGCIVVTCVLGARVTTALATFALSTRGARDVGAVLGTLLLVGTVPLVAALATIDWLKDGAEALVGVASVLGWTPLGAAWSAPAQIAAGATGAGLLQLLIALATAALVWVGWSAVVRLVLVTPQRVAPVKQYPGLGWFRLLGGSRTGAIAARTFTYWMRDPRYRVSFVIVPIVPLLILVPLLVAGVPATYLWLLPVPVMALFFAWSVHNDVALDHTAIWLHVTADLHGRADRWGRAVPVLAVGVPLVVIGSIVAASLSGDEGVLPAVLGVSLVLLLGGLGLASVLSAALPYPTARPGDNPFHQPQAAGANAGLIQSFSFLAVLAVGAPSIVSAVLYLVEGGGWNWVAMWSGVVIGTVVLLVGIEAGGRVFERRGTDLIAAALRN